MPHGEARCLILLDQGEAWRGHVLIHAQPAQDRPRQGGLARTQIAAERHRVADAEACGNACAKRRRRGKAVQRDFAHESRVFHDGFVAGREAALNVKPANCGGGAAMLTRLPVWTFRRQFERTYCHYRGRAGRGAGRSDAASRRV